jgi:hypothetical protein
VIAASQMYRMAIAWLLTMNLTAAVTIVVVVVVVVVRSGLVPFDLVARMMMWHASMILVAIAAAAMMIDIAYRLVDNVMMMMMMTAVMVLTCQSDVPLMTSWWQSVMTTLLVSLMCVLFW